MTFGVPKVAILGASHARRERLDFRPQRRGKAATAYSVARPRTGLLSRLTREHRRDRGGTFTPSAASPSRAAVRRAAPAARLLGTRAAPVTAAAPATAAGATAPVAVTRPAGRTRPAAMTAERVVATAATAHPARCSQRPARTAATRRESRSARRAASPSIARTASGRCAAPRSPLGTRGRCLAPPSRSLDPGCQPPRVVSYPPSGDPSGFPITHSPRES